MFNGHHENTEKTLNDLIRTSRDGERGFAEAAERTEKAELKARFRQRSADCRTAMIGLQQLATSLGETTRDDGPVVGTGMQRVWARVKITLGVADGGTPERTESARDRAGVSFVRASIARLPEHVRVAVQRQFDGAIHDHELIRGLRASHSSMEKSVAV